jgi:hypothetical protein
MLTNPVVLTDLERCREGKGQMLEVAEAISELEVRFCPCENRTGMPESACRARQYE